MGKHSGFGHGKNRRMFTAAAAGAAILLAGLGAPSLAAWVDNEWVAGTGGSGPGNPQASLFEVVQRSAGQTVFDNYETQATANAIDFTVNVRSMSPGSVQYAWVQLQTTSSSIAGNMVVKHGTTWAPVPNLFTRSLDWGARVVPATTDCDATGYAASSTIMQADGTGLDTSTGTQAVALQAAGGNTVTVCFKLELPTSANDEAMMGEQALPRWYFESTSS